MTPFSSLFVHWLLEPKNPVSYSYGSIIPYIDPYLPISAGLPATCQKAAVVLREPLASTDRLEPQPLNPLSETNSIARTSMSSYSSKETTSGYCFLPKLWFYHVLSWVHFFPRLVRGKSHPIQYNYVCFWMIGSITWLIGTIHRAAPQFFLASPGRGRGLKFTISLIQSSNGKLWCLALDCLASIGLWSISLISLSNHLIDSRSTTADSQPILDT